MKKQVKKMVLNRETLIHLEHLGRIAGGTSLAPCQSASCPNVCTFSGYATCNTCNNNTCGTNFC